MKEPLDLSYGLLTKAAHDLRAAEIGIENEAPLDTVAFHVQQCAEKLKAFLNWKLVQYPKTHALGALLDLAVPHQPDLESFRSRLLAMGSYAVEMRYDDELYPRRTRSQLEFNSLENSGRRSCLCSPRRKLSGNN